MRLSLLSGLLLLPLVIGCATKTWDDPKNTYDELVKAANAGKLGDVYDRLDTARRREFEKTIQMQLQHLDAFPPAERARWEALKGKSMRDIFAAVVGGDAGVAASLKGRYTVSRVDTFVVLTVKHEGVDTSLVYLRRENDSMKLSGPPARPIPPPMPVSTQVDSASLKGAAKESPKPAPGPRKGR